MSVEEQQKNQGTTSQNKQDSGHKTQIFLGILTLIGVISGGAFTNWDKIFSQSSNTQPSLNIPLQASVNGRYSTLIQRIECPDNRTKYGEFNEYGYYQGGDEWCGEKAQKGYWVWVYPNWYVWRDKN